MTLTCLVIVSLGALMVPSYLGMWFYFEDPNLRPQMKTPIVSSVVSFGTLLTHELIGVLFVHYKDDPVIASLVSLLLPATKYAVRYVQMKLLRGFQEGFATIVVSFEVQFFNSLYMALLMETVTSSLTLVVLMMVDVVENTYFLFSTHRKARQFKGDPTLKLKLLFRTELVVLLEFIEVVTPCNST